MFVQTGVLRAFRVILLTGCLGLGLALAVPVQATGTIYTYNGGGGNPAYERSSPWAVCQASLGDTQRQAELQFPTACTINTCVSCTETSCTAIRFGPSFQQCPPDPSIFQQSVGISRTAVQPEVARNSCTPPFCATGNPINQATGNKYQIEIDYTGEGAFPLVFARFYNSRGTVASKLGASWSHSFGQRIHYRVENQQQFASLLRADGKIFILELINGVWQPDGDVTLALSRLPGNTGWSVTTQADEAELYDASGKLISVSNRNGLTQTITYNSYDQVIRVEDAFGRALAFSYDQANRLSTVTDPAGGVIQYGYASASSLLQASVTDADGKTKTYLYNEPSLLSSSPPPGASFLTGIVDENGDRFASFGYTSSGGIWRATLTERAGGADRNTISYGAGTSTVADPLNTSRTFSFQSTNGALNLGSISGQPCPTCGAASQTFDTNGNVVTRVDWNGNRTDFTYDLVRNLEISRTEGLASGGGTTPQTRTISTQWNTTFRLPNGIAEPLRTTTNTYDLDGTACGARGALCSKTIQSTTDQSGVLGFSATPIGLPRTWTYTYNAYGATDG